MQGASQVLCFTFVTPVCVIHTHANVLICRFDVTESQFVVIFIYCLTALCGPQMWDIEVSVLFINLHSIGRTGSEPAVNVLHGPNKPVCLHEL